MSKRLENFLVDLGSDAELRKRVRQNAELEFRRARLTSRERDALRSGSAESIRSAMGLSASDHMTQFGISPVVADLFADLLERAAEFDVRLAQAEASTGTKKGPKPPKKKATSRKAAKRSKTAKKSKGAKKR